MEAQLEADFSPLQNNNVLGFIFLWLCSSVAALLGVNKESIIKKKNIQKQQTNLPLLYPPTQTSLCVKEKIS